VLKILTHEHRWAQLVAILQSAVSEDPSDPHERPLQGLGDVPIAERPQSPSILRRMRGR
jgi:hypothetical protein